MTLRSIWVLTGSNSRHNHVAYFGRSNSSLRLSLPFFLVMIDSWWPEPNLDTYSSRMHFFSFVLETEDDPPDIDVGRKGVHDWCCARGSVAFLFDRARSCRGGGGDSACWLLNRLLGF